MAAPDIVVVGSINHDVTVQVRRLPDRGETVLGSGHFTAAGGKGANQAVAAARLGASVGMVGRVGHDEPGRAMRSALAAEGVDTAGVTFDDQLGTGLALITVEEGGENTIVVSPGANAALTPARIEARAVWLATAAITLLQLEIPPAAVLTAASLAGGTVILNPAPGRRLPPELLERVDLLVPNRTELGVILGRSTPLSVGDAADAAARVQGPRATVVTLGADGALVVSGGSTTHFPAPEVDAVDATAAGDAFCGALADALLRGMHLEAAVEWAVLAGAVAVTRPGAQPSLPTAVEMLEWAQEA